MPRKFVPCRICGEPVQSHPQSHKLGPAHRACVVKQRVHGTVAKYDIEKCRCDECRAAKAAKQRRLYRAYAERTGKGYQKSEATKAWVPRPRVCERCGGVYRGWGERFCSQKCNGAALSAELRGVSCTDVVHVPKVHPSWEGQDLSRGWTLHGCECRWCGATFVMLHQRVTYCSTRCARSASRAKRRADRGEFWISRRDRLRIYERDRWVCQLCDGEVDRGAHYLDDLAPSLDHIECQSWSLVPDHSPSNLRLAHRICNALRGDRPGWVALTKLEAAA